jgi:hypothetical protein
MEQLLISKSDIKDICKNVSDNLDEQKLIIPAITEAQRIDLVKFIGESLYYDLTSNYLEAKYQTLINGGNYQDCNGNTVYFYGIKYILSWYAYSRILTYSSLHVTRAGSRRKTTTESDAYTQEVVNQMQNNAKSQAIFYEANTSKFLDKNADIYPFWEKCHDLNKRKSIKFVTTRKNRTNKIY